MLKSWAMISLTCKTHEIEPSFTRIIELTIFVTFNNGFIAFLWCCLHKGAIDVYTDFLAITVPKTGWISTLKLKAECDDLVFSRNTCDCVTKSINITATPQHQTFQEENVQVNLFTARQRSCEEVMFSQVSVILFGSEGEYVFSDDHHVSLEGGEYPRRGEASTRILNPPKHVRLASGQYASYGNAFLLNLIFCIFCNKITSWKVQNHQSENMFWKDLNFSSRDILWGNFPDRVGGSI